MNYLEKIKFPQTKKERKETGCLLTLLFKRSRIVSVTVDAKAVAGALTQRLFHTDGLTAWRVV